MSIPVANAPVADAHRRVAAAGKTLVLLDDVPTGLLPGRDYAALVSADDFGLGRPAPELLSPCVPRDAEIALLTYGADLHATDERDIAFGRWIAAHRAALALRTARFPAPEAAGETARLFLRKRPSLAGPFVVWEMPALEAVAALGAEGVSISTTTVDLGHEAALALASGGAIRGIAARQPFQQGVSAANAAVLAMPGRPVPARIALPGLAVTRDDVAEAHQAVWNAQAPAALPRDTRCRRG